MPSIPYHASIKLFNPEKDSHHEAHKIANQLNLSPPDPRHVSITPIELRGRYGNKMYALRLEGKHADSIADHNSKFSHMGHTQNYQFKPHVTVDKETWDRVKTSGAKTAHEAGIKFHNAELRHGNKTIYHYVPKMEKFEPKKIAATLGIAGALATASPAKAQNVDVQHKYDRNKMLRTLASVESSGGKDVSHKPIKTKRGIEYAYGKYGLGPDTIRDTIKMHKDLRQTHGKAMALSGKDLVRYMQDNPHLEEDIAQRHVARVEHHFGKNPAHIGYAWLNGIKGTYKARRKGKNIDAHWHVKKIKQNYPGRK